MKWFEEVFFPSLVERYERQGEFKLSDKQVDICARYMKDTKNVDFCQEFNGYGIWQCHYSSKNPRRWRNGFWFGKM